MTFLFLVLQYFTVQLPSMKLKHQAVDGDRIKWNYENALSLNRLVMFSGKEGKQLGKVFAETERKHTLLLCMTCQIEQ